MNKLLIASLLILTSVFAYANPTPEAKALIKKEMDKASHITAKELNEELKDGKNVVLIDVRQKSERPILGLITEKDVHIPRGFLEIKTYSKVTDKNTPIVVYCGKGIRSAFATNTLKQMGYTNVKNLKGGVKAWKESGLTALDVK